ncbi:quercetin 2,3-dioxygenase [Gracilibacillus sp. S3-1-1]|uniref:Quercetin 2,3-dioxygenase n=1 Tax=Gracilibacillus pellucidus TaxID=3095368 RepID=A0ACC6M7C7_9BACI|nr:quercetin 2,3-dioxygenase [Gracilibacillus sp. S3-1-1]MDX8046844.1 quercetin 2,3-dioxygenase [Gracilibacillus sp. S3-1-1]
MQSTMFTGLPMMKKPYLLRAAEGERFLFGSQVATFMADKKSTDNKFEIVLISGGKGDSFPFHVHDQTYEGILLLDGKLELSIDEESYLLLPGDYAHIPPGTIHSYRMQGHRTRFISYTANGETAGLYSIIGQPYRYVERPPHAGNEVPREKFMEASNTMDVRFLWEREMANAKLVDNNKLPDSITPYVLEAGEGERLVAGDQLHRIITSQKNTDGHFIIVASEGPKGERINDHYHEHHTETFFCLEGKMTMWANGEEIELYPGDFLHVPENTVHAYRFDSHYTKMVGLLATGLFEPFFRALGDPYEYHTFPNEPNQLRFDRVLENIDNLDLKIIDQE